MSSFRYHLVPIFTDNYVFVIENTESHAAVVVDPGSAEEVISFLKQKQLKLSGVLITHHHADHIDGLEPLLDEAIGIDVFAPEKNKAEVQQATNYVQEGDVVEAIGLTFKVFDLPGHTLGHIGYFAEGVNWLFSGDVLFGLGCGRLFEGSPEQQFNSLNKIKNLPVETKVFCTHEYTERNLQFCKKVVLTKKLLPNLVESDLEKYESELELKRSSNLPSVPLELAQEIKCNPFLLSENVKQFAEIRQLRNKF